MASLSINLEHQIDGLRGLKEDLEEYYWTVTGPRGVLTALGVVISQVALRTAALEDVLRQHGTGTVQVEGLTDSEARTALRAVGVLDKELVLPAGAPSSVHWAKFRAALGAIDDLLVSTLRALPGQGELAGPTDGRGVVLSLVRSGK